MNLKKLIGLGFYFLVFAWNVFGIIDYFLIRYYVGFMFSMILSCSSCALCVIFSILGFIEILKDEDSIKSVLIGAVIFTIPTVSNLVFYTLQIVRDSIYGSTVHPNFIVSLLLSVVILILLIISIYFVKNAKKNDSLKETLFTKSKNLFVIALFLSIICSFVVRFFISGFYANTQIIVFFVIDACVDLAGIAFLLVDRFI